MTYHNFLFNHKITGKTHAHTKRMFPLSDQPLAAFLSDDPVAEESDSDTEDEEERKEANKENNVRLRELERRLENVGTTDDEIKQMEDDMAGIKDYD